jgi:uncharacterized FAD-dependent dehydrogenase
VAAAASEAGGVTTNGMSLFARAGKNANAALCVSVDERDFDGEGPLAGIDFQRQWERLAFEMGGGAYAAPLQLLGDFLENRPSAKLGGVAPTYARGFQFANMRAAFGAELGGLFERSVRLFGRKLPGFDDKNAVLTGFETRTSAPVRILRGEDGVCPGFGGVYPIGEGAGYAGGVMSAAVDGVRAAERIIQKYRRA